MPLKKCSNDGKSGWKWGDSGKCYTGPSGKKDAIKQGIKIEGPEKFSQIAHELPIVRQDVDCLAEYMMENGYSIPDITITLAAVSRSLVGPRFMYEDQKTGEQFIYKRMGNYKKDGRILIFIKEL